jgi:Beta-propeller repeat
VAVDGNGNVVVAGYFGGTANFGGGSFTSSGGNDIFVAKYASDGSYVWAKRFGGTGSDYGYGVAVDGSGNVVVTGNFTNTVDFGGGPLNASTSGGDIFLAKYGPSGAYLWAKHFGGTSTFGSIAYAVAVDSSGNPLLTGWINDFVDFGGGPLTALLNSYDIFVAKFNSAGTYQWAKRVGADASDYGNSVAVDSSGNVLVAGYFTTSADFDCGTLNSPGGMDGYAVKLTP